MTVRDIELTFAVSSDEEHVELRLGYRGRVIRMGARARNYLLLTLARRRLEDTRAGCNESNCGWVYQDECPNDPGMAPLQLNLDVYRIRKQFAAAGVSDAANIVERRPVTRQLRIGVSHISIDRL